MSLLAMLPLAASVAVAAAGGGLVEPRRQPLFVCIQQQQQQPPPSLVASLCTLSLSLSLLPTLWSLLLPCSQSRHCHWSSERPPFWPLALELALALLTRLGSNWIAADPPGALLLPGFPLTVGRSVLREH